MFNPKKRNLIYSAFFVSLVVILASFSPLRSSVITILKFPLILFSSIGREIKGVIFYHSNYVRLDTLKKENELLKWKLNQSLELTVENQRLQGLLAFKQKSPFKVIAARVIGRSADNWGSGLIIDKGRFSGIRSGQVVINLSGLIGRVTEVSASISKITLINDQNMSISAIAQRSRQEGLVSGTLGGSLLMHYLPKDADIEINDNIITSGLTEIFPKGLVIGTVTDTGEEFSGLSRYAVIKPAANLSGIEEVLIVFE